MSSTLFRYKMTECEKDQVVAIYNHVKSISAINQAYGFSKRSRVVKRVLQERGIDILLGKRKIPVSQEKEIVDKYLAGVSSYQLSDEYGIAVSAICNLLERNNTERRDNKILTLEQEKEVVKDYLSGESMWTVGDKFGIDGSTVPLILKRHGYTTRPAGHNSRIYSLNENFFDDLSNEYAAYVLGFIYADGSINKETLTIALSIKDLDHLEKIRALLEYENTIEHYKVTTPQKKKKPAVRLCVHSKKITERLTNLGIVKGRNHFNNTLYFLPPEIYRHFIRGFVDGDGCLDYHKKKWARIRILGQRDILTWITATISEELDISRKNLRQRIGIMTLEYGGPLQAKKIITWLYKDANIFLERKINRMTWFK